MLILNIFLVRRTLPLHVRRWTGNINTSHLHVLSSELRYLRRSAFRSVVAAVSTDCSSEPVSYVFGLNSWRVITTWALMLAFHRELDDPVFCPILACVQLDVPSIHSFKRRLPTRLFMSNLKREYEICGGSAHGATGALMMPHRGKKWPHFFSAFVSLNNSHGFVQSFELSRLSDLWSRGHTSAQREVIKELRTKWWFWFKRNKVSSCHTTHQMFTTSWTTW